MQISTKANIYLIAIAIIWGLTFPLIRNAMDNIDPVVFVFLRFLMASTLLFFLIIPFLKFTSKKIVTSGIFMGLLNSIAYIAQTKGLQTISASRSAFITGVSVVLVPFLAKLFKIDDIRSIDWVCSILCFIGIFVLTGLDFGAITIGDAWTLMGAIAFALQIIYFQHISNHIKQYLLFTFYQLLFTIPLALIISPKINFPAILNTDVLVALIFCACFATILTYFIQAKYQKFTTPQKVAFIFALEPVFACIFGLIINHEVIEYTTILGGGIILLSLVLPSLVEILGNSKAKWSKHE